MNTTDLMVEVLILGFQVFTWLWLIIGILFGFDWISFVSFKDWVAMIALFVIGASYTLGIIFDNFFFSLFENRNIAIKTIRKIIVDEERAR